MMKRSLTLVLIGAGFAGGMTLAMSCNIGRSSTAHDAAARQDKGEKKEAQEDKEEEDDEAPIQLADAPEPVRAAILRLAPEKSIKKVSREDDDGIVVFEVEYESDGAACSADLSDKGMTLALEKEIKTADVPEAAMKTLTQRFPTARIKTVSSVQTFLYEADIEVDGKGREVKVYASGKMPGHHD
jgi:hypothetical protein